MSEPHTWSNGPTVDPLAVIERVRELSAEMLTVNIALRDSFTPALREATIAFAAFGRSVRRVTWALRRADYEAHGRTRPNGRPRGSGHRHRGTVAWARRHG